MQFAQHLNLKIVWIMFFTFSDLLALDGLESLNHSVSANGRGPPHTRRETLVFSLRGALRAAADNDRRRIAVALCLATVHRAPTHALTQVLASAGPRCRTPCRSEPTHRRSFLRALCFSRVFGCIYCML